MSAWQQPIVDPLHGPVVLDDPLLSLMRSPIVQRLRHVRLSNIDSIDMPSIANLSRFEHVVGVAHLAGAVSFRASLNEFDNLVLLSSAMLHDWAITSFGHLVEEALQYVGTRFDHEEKLKAVLTRQPGHDVLGVDLQILVGRETGLSSWARRTVGEGEKDRLLSEIMDHIRGKGRMGRMIAGDIDLDNIDNVYRMAFHLGLPVDRETPKRIATSIVGVWGKHGDPVFRAQIEPQIQDWMAVRRQVYEHLMLAQRDFAGKTMMLFATVEAHRNGELTSDDWSLIDHAYMMRLLNSKVRIVKETVERWVAGELWHASPLWWMSGQRPDYPDLLKFSQNLTESLGRHCFAYAIKDKRERRLTIRYDSGIEKSYGNTPARWLLGVGSSTSKPFTSSELKRLIDIAQSMFGTSVISTVAEEHERESQPCLF